MPGQSESSTRLNTNVTTGDLIRDLAVTPTETGVAVKQQVVTIGDPVFGDGLASVSIRGELYVRNDDLLSVNRSILRELRRIRWLLTAVADKSSDDEDIDSEEEF